MKNTSNQYYKRIYTVIFMIIIIIGIAVGARLSISGKEPNKLIEHKTDYSYVQSLKDSVQDLETKARILNNYLNMKHLEYIEVCDLVAKRKTK
jgi:hypothetical protein